MSKRKPGRGAASWRWGQWEYRFIFEEQNGSVVLVMLAVFPYGTDFKGVALPDRPSPRGGITGDTLRRFRIEERIANELRLRALPQPPGSAPMFRVGGSLASFSPTLRVGKPKPGRPGRGDLFYAMVAREYEERGKAGSRTPVRDMAADHHMSPSRMTALVHAARAHGFLTKGKPGRSGGRMTAKARAVLAQFEPTKTKRRRK